MPEFGLIRADFDVMLKNYTKYNHLHPAIAKHMKGLNDATDKENVKRAAEGKKLLPHDTPCCFQVSHSLNAAGQMIYPNSYRRRNPQIVGGNGYYLGAVDELEHYLAIRYGRTEDIKSGRKSKEEVKEYIDGYQGILVSRDTGYGFHTELWDNDTIIQKEGIS
jgi:hypothetical protein